MYPSIFRLKDKGFLNFKWIGWPGIYPQDKDEQDQIRDMLSKYRCVPIWFTKEEIEKFTLYMERFIRPLFHNFKGTDDNEIDESNCDLW